MNWENRKRNQVWCILWESLFAAEGGVLSVPEEDAQRFICAVSEEANHLVAMLCDVYSYFNLVHISLRWKELA